MSENVSVYGCASRPLPPGRYFLSEELVWRILSGIVHYHGHGAQTISRKEVRRFIVDHTCPTCGRVFLSRIELMTHHATELFAGIEVIDPAENIIDIDRINPKFGKSKVN